VSFSPVPGAFLDVQQCIAGRLASGRSRQRCGRTKEGGEEDSGDSSYRGEGDSQSAPDAAASSPPRHRRMATRRNPQPAEYSPPSPAPPAHGRSKRRRREQERGEAAPHSGAAVPLRAAAAPEKLPKGHVRCPNESCGALILELLINVHLDQCLRGDKENAGSGAVAGLRRRQLGHSSTVPKVDGWPHDRQTSQASRETHE
jgi:hypothetical protein